MSADTRSGRVCPLRYRYSVESLGRPPQIRAHTACVIGGLYGNREALDTIFAMAAQERRRGVDVTLIFNGDFDWLDLDPEDFVHISATVLCHAAISGNVEAEPEGSPAHQSYHDRLVDGPDFSLRQAARDGVTLYAKRGTP